MTDVEVLDTNGNDAVNPRIVETVQKALEKGKRHFGVAGASLTWMNSPQQKKMLPEGWKPKVLEEATKAEQNTSAMIREWLKDKPNGVLIDSVHIKGAGKEKIDPETGLIEGGDTDHVLVFGGVVFIIDTKNWRKKATYTVSDTGSVLRNGKPFPGGNVHINKATSMWFNYLDSSNVNVTVQGMIFINNEDAEDTHVFRNQQWYNYYWSLVELSRFTQLLDKKYDKEVKDDDREVIDPALIAQIAQCCVKPYNRREGLINTKNFH